MPPPYNPFPPPPNIYTSQYPVNTAQAVGNLYTQALGTPSGLAPLIPDPTRIPFVGPPGGNSAAAVGNLYGSYPSFSGGAPASGLPQLPLGAGQVPSSLYLPNEFAVPMGELPAGGTTGIYNNRLLQQAAAGRGGVTNVAGGTTAGGTGVVPPRGALPAAGGTGVPGYTAAEVAAGAGATERSLLGRLLNEGGPKNSYAIGRGILGGLAGNFLANQVPGDSALAQALQGGLRGAGMGAAFGWPGVAIGGGVGALSDALNIPVLQDIFGGIPDQPKPPDFDTTYRDTLNRVNSAFTAAGIPADQQQQFFSSLNGRLALAGDDEDARRDILATIIPAATNVLDTAESQAATQTPRMTPQDIATIQAMVGSFTQPYAQQYVNSTNQLAGIMNETASTLPPAYRQAIQQQAQQQVANANQYAAALQQQAATLPAFSAYQMAISQAYQQPRSSGATDLASVIAAMPPAT